jgi:periplasmic protein TonB
MFDTALIESGVHEGDHAAIRKLPFAIGLHAAVIGALVSSAVISTAEPPEPAIPIAFPESFTGGPPPPPPAGEGPAPIPAVIAPVRAEVPTLRIPDEAPLEVPHEMPVGPDHIGDDSIGAGGPGVPGGDPNGVVDGVPGGTGASERVGPEDDGPILQPGVGGVTIPELLERIDPAYPDVARKLRQEGTVVLEAVITSSGMVDEVRVVASRGPLLDAAAVSAVRRWRYRPATLNGRAVAVFLTVTIRFGLNG